MTNRTVEKFYKDAKVYWSKVPPTLDGVLGGYTEIAEKDIEGSKSFLESIFALENPPERNSALDCGAGIGRITKNLLTHYFNKVDLVEQDDKFVAKARDFIGESKNLGLVYHKALQNFAPAKDYDVIWCQWVLGHLNDNDLIGFLKRCSASLSPNGVIIIKENISGTNQIEFDEVDSSVARPLKLMNLIFKLTHLSVVHTEVQRDFPDEIYDVHMFALVPYKRTGGFNAEAIDDAHADVDADADADADANNDSIAAADSN